ncbi:MAG TPA: helix-turn-helix domain-containing protein [Pilimelia sp.]|nr:helix-turn-helix domain-containing protein [Pilimelia sp.]
MSSQRNTTGPAGAPGAAPVNGRTPDDTLLDAARTCVIAVGLRRTTLTDVARRAGVSRMTMYRRWPDMASLMADLMTREWVDLAQRALAEATGRTARERVVSMLLSGVRDLRAHPVFRRIIELDPEVLLPYVVDRRGTSQDHVLGMLTEAIDAGRADGSIRAGNPALLARSALLAVHGFVLSSATMTDEVSEADLDGELAILLDDYLAP